MLLRAFSLITDPADLNETEPQTVGELESSFKNLTENNVKSQLLEAYLLTKHLRWEGK